MELLKNIKQDFVSKALAKNKTKVLILSLYIYILVSNQNYIHSDAKIIGVVYDLQIHQMNVKKTFLNVELEEEIYMEQPEGFVVPGK